MPLFKNSPTLDAIADLETDGILVRSGEDTAAAVTLTGTTNNIVVTNGNGVSGNPTFDVGSNVLLTSSSINALSDVDTTTTPPTSGDSFSWDGSNWAPATPQGYIVFPVWAEENGNLGQGNEWSFGNGSGGNIGIPLGLDCELFAVSFNAESTGTSISIDVRRGGSAVYTASFGSANDQLETLISPVTFSAGDRVGFDTSAVSGGYNDGRVCAWFRVRATPGSTSVLNDLLDVSLGPNAQGDLLYFDGSNWTNLGPGTVGQLLQSGGAGADPAWVTANHASLTNLGWASSGHTGTASRIAAFDGSGAASFLQVGVDVQAYDADLAALAGLSTTGIIVRNGAGTVITRSLTGPPAGINVSNGDGVAGNPTLSLANDLAALEGLASTGFAARTGSDAWAQRTLTGTTNNIVVTNGNGVSGNPVINVGSDVVLWSALPTPKFADYYNTASFTINTTATTIQYNSTRQSNAAFTLAGNQVTIVEGGTYRFDWDLSLDESNAVNRTIELWIEVNGAEAPGTRTRTWHDSQGDEGNAHGMAILTVSASDIVRVRGQVTVTVGSSTATRANSVRLLIQSIGTNGANGTNGTDGATGPQGPPGPTGSGSSITVQDGGGVVPGGPFATLNFVGAGVTASNAGGSVAAITIPGPNVFQGRFTTGTVDLNQATPTPIPITAEDVKDSNYTHSNVTNNTRVTFAVAGLYRVHYNIGSDNSSNNRCTLQTFVRRNGTTEVSPSRAFSYSRNNTDDRATNTATFLMTAAASDYIEMVSQQEGTSGTALASPFSTWILVEYVRP